MKVWKSSLPFKNASQILSPCLVGRMRGKERNGKERKGEKKREKEGQSSLPFENASKALKVQDSLALSLLFYYHPT